MAAAVLLGVDVGGTFTDAVARRRRARCITAKAPTTPGRPVRGRAWPPSRAALERGRRATPATSSAFAHGMTVATNALLEGTGARTALVATEGFTDVVELGRQARAGALPPVRRAPGAARAARAPRRRARAHGPRRRAARARRRGRRARSPTRSPRCEPEAVAVCLLHAYRHPEHERALGDALRERLGADVHVSLSHEVVGTFREFERAATTEVDAALSPLLARLPAPRCVDARGEAGLPEPAIMQSSGGLADAEHAAGHAALTVLSGPAGGAAAAALLAERVRRARPRCASTWAARRATSASSRTARVREAAGREVGGRPLALPMVDIHTVGAGGGSIAWRDAGGALRVGPALGGRRARARRATAAAAPSRRSPTPTSSSAASTRERRWPAASTLDAGRRAARGRRARRASSASSPRPAPRASSRVANAEMVRALRVMTVERGVDPRDFALLAFGGAGPLHAARDRRRARHRPRSSCRARPAC